MAGILQTIGLSKQYQMGEVTVEALRGVDFAVEKGEFVAIMGPSGSGKSTLLHMLGGLDIPSDGEIMLGGRRLAQLSDDDITIVRRRQVGFIFQFFNLLPTLSAAENVALPLLIDGRSLDEYRLRIDELLTLVGLGDRQDHKPDQLSGGQQQRVAIARALVNSPDIMLFDEPTSALDPELVGEVLAVIRALAEEHMTMLIVTHEMRFARDISDRVLFLDEGRKVADAPPAEIFENPDHPRIRQFLKSFFNG